MINKLLIPFLGFVVFLFFPKTISAQVVINEVSPASSPEWVELYNTSTDIVLLKDYVINFGNTNQNKSFCDDDKINGGSYRLITLSSSWLNNDGDVVILKDTSGEVDLIGYGSGFSLSKPSSNQSITRFPDGNSNWMISDTPSQQGSSVLFDCPTPIFTSTPTPTPTPTNSPTPTGIPVPTQSPTPKSTVKPIATRKPVSESDLENGDEIVLGLREELEEEEEVVEEEEKKIHWGAYVFIIVGVGFFGIAGYSFYLQKKKNPENDDKGKKENLVKPL